MKRPARISAACALGSIVVATAIASPASACSSVRHPTTVARVTSSEDIAIAEAPGSGWWAVVSGLSSSPGSSEQLDLYRGGCSGRARRVRVLAGSGHSFLNAVVGAPRSGLPVAAWSETFDHGVRRAIAAVDGHRQVLGAGSSPPSLTVDVDGTATVAMAEAHGIRIWERAASAPRFARRATVASPAPLATPAVLVGDRAGDRVLAWGTSDGRVLGAHGRAGGGFDAPQTLQAAGPGDVEVAAAEGAGRRGVVVWRAGTTVAAAERRGTAGFGAPVTLSSSAAPDEPPAVAIDRTGRAVIAAVQASGVPAVGTWLPGAAAAPLAPVPGAQAHSPVRVAIDARGVARLVYSYRAPGAASDRWSQTTIAGDRTATRVLFGRRAGVISVVLAPNSSFALWAGAAGVGRPTTARVGQLPV